MNIFKVIFKIKNPYLSMFSVSNQNQIFNTFRSLKFQYDLNRYKQILPFHFLITIIFVILIFSSNQLFSYAPPEREKPFIEYFKLNEFPQSQNIIKFMNVGLIISNHCVSQKSGKNYRRECGAWKPMDVLESGRYIKYFTPNKVLPDIRNLRSVSFFICQQAGGSIASEVIEFTGGRDVNPLDFCQFPDNSLLALISIENYIKTIPNFSKTVTFD
jgi:hypothetical protein